MTLRWSGSLSPKKKKSQWPKRNITDEILDYIAQNTFEYVPQVNWSNYASNITPHYEQRPSKQLSPSSWESDAINWKVWSATNKTAQSWQYWRNFYSFLKNRSKLATELATNLQRQISSWEKGNINQLRYHVITWDEDKKARKKKTRVHVEIPTPGYFQNIIPATRHISRMWGFSLKSNWILESGALKWNQETAFGCSIIFWKPNAETDIFHTFPGVFFAVLPFLLYHNFVSFLNKI